MKLMLSSSFTSTGGMTAATEAHQRWALCFSLLIRSGVLSRRWAPQLFDCGPKRRFQGGQVNKPEFAGTSCEQNHTSWQERGKKGLDDFN